eukprot:scaffold591_cov372-Prasinococcus_capsulatus_cf.AAC.13
MSCVRLLLCVVGNRTTIRLVNTQHMGFYEFEDEVILQHVTQEGFMRKFLKFKESHPNLRAYATDGDFHQYVLDTMRDGAASNGFYGLVLALELCERVDLFGYAKDWNEQDVPGKTKLRYHYYDAVEPNVSQQSRDDKEKPRFQKFLREYSDTFTIV